MSELHEIRLQKIDSLNAVNEKLKSRKIKLYIDNDGLIKWQCSSIISDEGFTTIDTALSDLLNALLG